MNDELIKRLKAMRPVRWAAKDEQTIKDAITALSAPLPDEVEETYQACKTFSEYHEAHWPEKVTIGTAQYWFKQAADLIERLVVVAHLEVSELEPVSGRYDDHAVISLDLPAGNQLV